MNVTEKLFADEWIKNRNKTEAYLSCHPECKSRKAAATKGGEIWKRGEVQTYISEKIEEISKNAGLTVQRVMEEEACLSLSDVRQIFNGNTPIAPSELPEVVARAIKSVKQVTKNVFHADGRCEIIVTYEYVFWDKGASLRRVEKYLGMDVLNIDVTTKGQSIDTPEEVLRRFAFMLRNTTEKGD